MWNLQWELIMFVKRLDRLIKEHNIKRNKLLTDLGLNKSSIINWEKRGTIPNGETLEKIADYFNVSVDYLLGKEKEPSVQNGEFDELTMQFNNLLGKLSQEQKEALIPLLESMIQQKK